MLQGRSTSTPSPSCDPEKELVSFKIAKMKIHRFLIRGLALRSVSKSPACQGFIRLPTSRTCKGLSMLTTQDASPHCCGDNDPAPLEILGIAISKSNLNVPKSGNLATSISDSTDFVRTNNLH
jgi:hypothetical protein